MGMTQTGMHKHVQDKKDTMVVVTIITDGMENASREYNGKTIKDLVERLRGEGWTFTYMGANQDSVEVAMSMSIRNARNFDYSNEGTRASMQKDSSTRMNFFGRLAKWKTAEMKGCCAVPASESERRNLYANMADEAFDEEENK